MRSSDSKDRLSAPWLGLLIVVCLACDFFMVPVLAMVPPGPPKALAFPLLLAIVGCVLAQGCLLAAWLALGDQPFWQRLTRHWIVAAILYLVWAAGLAVGQNSQLAVVGIMVGLSVPLVSIGAQMPLWFARQAFGWRLIRGEEKNDAGPAPLAIRDLMMATVLVALALALARLAPSPDGKGLELVWIVMFVVASAISTMALLPTAPLLLRVQPLARGLLFAGMYAAFWVGLLWLVVLVGWRQGLFMPPPLAVVVGVSSLILSFAATVMLAAAAARARGYRLIWGRPGRQEPGTE